MTTSVSLFLGLLTLVAAAADAAVLALAALGWAGRSGWARRQLGSVAVLVGPHRLLLAALVAVTATAGSLYYSEVAGFVPCELCWFQRVAMYPLAVILIVALVHRDAGVRPYAVSLAALGLPISAYHALLQRLPGLPAASCSLEAPCTAIWVNTFGFISIPVMAGVAFATVIVALALPAGPAKGVES